MGPVLENPNDIHNQNLGFGYYGYISEDTIPGSGSELWSQLWEDINNLVSPEYPLSFPSSHASLQLGSSSTYYSPQRDVLREEFENLKIFNAIMDDQIMGIEEVNR